MDSNLQLLQAHHSGDASTEKELVDQNMGLVRSIAVRFLYSGTDYEDLCQIGCLGLVKAIRNFDFSKGVMFSTYAVPVIIGEIRKFLRDDGPVKVSRSIREQYIKIQRAEQALSKQLERSPTINEIARHTGLQPEEVISAMDAGGRPLSLDEPVAESDDRSLADMVADEDSISDIERLALKDGISRLDPLDRKIISLRYFCSKTQVQTAQILNMTQVQVSRREKKILQSLRAYMQ